MSAFTAIKVAFDEALADEYKDLNYDRKREDGAAFKQAFDNFINEYATVDVIFYDPKTFHELRKCDSATFKRVILAITCCDVDTEDDYMAVLSYEASDNTFNLKKA
jgi:hypothetical protein